MKLLTIGVIFPLMTISLQAQDLSSYRWKKRLVILFAGGELPAQQAELAKEKRGLAERDVEIIPVTADEEKLHKKYGVKNGEFTFVLIGKDGGEKFRSEKVVGVQKLFSQIDAMPMRKDEAAGR